MAAPTYSVVLPVYNEAENISKLYEQLNEVMSKVGDTFELIFVNDGSRDDSPEIIRALAENNPSVKLISFSRNFGHQPAVSAGLMFARGKAVLVMDSDLQDSPYLIPEFIKEWQAGNKVVYAIRQSRQEGFFKKLAYRVFYRVFASLSDTDIPLDSGDFSLMDRKVVDLINILPERTRYIRGLRAWVGFKQTGIKVDRDSRNAGNPKYSFIQLVNLALVGIISFSLVPLRFATGLGILVSGLSFLSIILVCALRIFTTWSIPGFAATASIVLFGGGVQLLTVGILGEYIGRIFEETKARPMYIVEDTVGFSEKT